MIKEQALYRATILMDKTPYLIQVEKVHLNLLIVEEVYYRFNNLN